MKTRNHLTALCVAIATLGMAGVAQADTATSKFNVTIKITKACTVNAGSGQAGKITSDSYTVAGADLDFGQVASSSTADVTATGNAGTTNGIQVNCTKGTGYTIGLAPSNNNQVGVGSMSALNTGSVTGNTDTIEYTLWQNSARTTVWGNTTTGTINVLTDTGTGAVQSHPVYGKVAGSQLNKTADRYADQVTATITY